MILCPFCGTVPTPAVEYGYNDGECRCGRTAARGGTNPSNQGAWVLSLTDDVRVHGPAPNMWFGGEHPILDGDWTDDDYEATDEQFMALVMKAVEYEIARDVLTS